jgi:dynein light intermediate chain 1
MANRVSVYTTGSGDSEGRDGEQKKDLWTSMLESVASGKRLPEKNLIVLGMQKRASHVKSSIS